MNNLKKLIDSITKQGIDASLLSDDASPCVVSDFMSTGCYVLDAIMGGGLPLGRVVEIYGDTSTGKSLIAAQACACCQDIGGQAVYIDTETAVSLPIMEAVGVDVDNLVYTAPDTVSQVFKVMETVIEGKADTELLIVWDSIAATSSEVEMDKETGAVGYLTHARVISQGLRKLTRMIAKRKVAMLFLNQSKVKIGMIFGDKVATFGGRAVGFHSSIRVQMRVAKKIVDKKKRVVGINVVGKVTKNKVAPPFREATFPIYFGHGIDEDEAIFAFLKNAEFIKHTGSGNYNIRYGAGWSDGTFKKSGWGGIVYANWDEICSLVDEAARGEDLL